MSELIEKLSKARNAANNFDKDGRNKDQNYSYISADQVLSRIGTALADVGVIVLPSVTAESVETVTYDSYGKTKSRIDATVEFEMVMTDGESSMTAHWVGRGTDYSTPDKALYKAITSGHKYFLMKLFNVGVGNEDSEHDSDNEPVSRPLSRPLPTRPASPQPEHSGVVDWRQELAEMDAITYADVATAVFESSNGKYNAFTHAFNALLKHPDLEPYASKLKNQAGRELQDTAKALEWFDWLVDRKATPQQNGLPIDTQKEVIYE